MAEMQTGSSWLYDTILSKLKERQEFLKDAMSRGLPYHEYINFVGRHKECLRQQNELGEIFTDFHQSEEMASEDEELKEIE